MPLTITRASDMPVNEGDEVEVQVSRAVDGLTGTRLAVGYSSDLIEVRWLAPDRFAFTMRRDGARSCKFVGAVERGIYESPSTTRVPLIDR